MGYEDTRYDYAARNLFRAGMPLSQGVFLGLYILWLGEHTANYIHAPFTAAILKDNGLQFEDQKKIDSIDQKVRLFTAQFEAQFLACSDTGLQGEEFAKALTEFGATVIQFRREFIEGVGRPGHRHGTGSYAGVVEQRTNRHDDRYSSDAGRSREIHAGDA